MKANDLQYYKIIEQLHAGISLSENSDDAAAFSLKIILANSWADYAVIWRADDSEMPVLRPMYWICPVDLSSCSYRAGEGLVGRVFISQKTETVLDCKNGNECSWINDFAGIDVGSVICLPLNSGDKFYGCVQFIKAAENGQFTPDEVGACELLTKMVRMELDEEATLANYVPKEKVLLSVRNIHKCFQNGETKSHVLKGVNFDVCEGEFLCLFGESGCGKSTMLNIIGGLIDFDEGSIIFAENELSEFTREELTEYRRNNIGFIFQAYNLMPNLNAKQNIDLVGELVQDHADSLELLRLVGLAEKADSYPAQLSGGQQQRIAIARAMVKKPKLILADEPTAALDYATSVEVLSVMEDLVKSGTSLIIVTHNEEIAKMADRVVRLRDGKTYEIKVNAHPLHATDLVW